MHKNILRIALPSIMSNITVPLLALADTTIAGHLGQTAFIGAIAVGGMLFNMTYWLFGFLRMGTGGLTAQAFGAGHRDEVYRILMQAAAVAGTLAGLILLLQRPVCDVAFRLMDASPEVEHYARRYFFILVWGAPAVLGQYVLTGWFLGMQDARSPMYVAVSQNAVNVCASLFLVLVLGWKVEGVAAGTLAAQYFGLAAALRIWRKRYRPAHRPAFRDSMTRTALGRFFRVNRDIFLRTLCLVATTTVFTATGAEQGDGILAANALLMQMFLLFSYVMDGFAYAGEALGGRCAGAEDGAGFRRTVRGLFAWGGGLALLFTAVYALCGTTLLELLTDRAEVVDLADAYLPYAEAIPLAGFAAFLLDGLYIGTTSTRVMLGAMAVATAAFLLVLHTLQPLAGNHALWVAFLLYLALRGAIQLVALPGIMRGIGRRADG
ncbi:MAG: MATE family efflux transporter [Bacteroidaceae bacterium]|nr:MATE family efflux transporter [Bacteroidaceae bacterium]